MILTREEERKRHLQEVWAVRMARLCRLNEAENACAEDDRKTQAERQARVLDDARAAREIQELRRWAAEHAPRKAGRVTRRDGGRVVLSEERDRYAGRDCIWTRVLQGGRECIEFWWA
jgi:hypothetical protein